VVRLSRIIFLPALVAGILLAGLITGAMFGTEMDTRAAAAEAAGFDHTAHHGTDNVTGYDGNPLPDTDRDDRVSSIKTIDRVFSSLPIKAVAVFVAVNLAVILSVRAFRGRGRRQLLNKKGVAALDSARSGY